jgi:hypothetical protein
MKKERIILRSQNVSNDLLSSFGQNIKETRLTSYLGYLFSLDITELNFYFGIDNPIQNIFIEKYLETQRSDIIISTIKKHIIIEAKINNSDTSNQLSKQLSEYKKKIKGKIELISLTRNNRTFKNNKIKSKSWNEIYDCLTSTKFKTAKQRILCEEFMKHLSNSGLVTVPEKEVYARDVNKEPYLSLFIKGHLYFCKYNENIYKCSYFAPYFGNQISIISPGVIEGMSYIAQIYNHLEVNSYSDLKQAIIKHIKKKKLKSIIPNLDEKLKEIKSDSKYDEKQPHTLLLLNKPRLLFNPPIDKKSLQDGTGWLSKNYYEFEELFKSAGI